MVEALSRIRAGDLNAATLSFIAKCQRPLTEDDGILSTVLCCTSYTHHSANEPAHLQACAWMLRSWPT